jgi:hypothetical protein
LASTEETVGNFQIADHPDMTRTRARELIPRSNPAPPPGKWVPKKPVASVKAEPKKGMGLVKGTAKSSGKRKLA